MKKIALFLALSVLLFADGYKEFAHSMQYETNYDKALERAKTEGKNVMVLMITNYCPWCAKFEKRTLSDATIDAEVKKAYIPVIINKEERKFPSFLNVPIVPTIFFIDAKEQKILHQSVGFSNKADFATLLESLHDESVQAQ